MKISICVPIYKVEKYIERCARSLFEQTYNDIEFIFVNDCSPDNSINILSKVLQEYPDRIEQVRILNHEYNRGLSAARNTAVLNCTGEYILWVDSDDYIEQDALKLLYEKVAEGNFDVIFFDYYTHYLQKTVLTRQPICDNPSSYCVKVLERSAPVSLWSHFIKTKLYRNNIAAVEGVNIGEDYQVLPKLIYYAKSVSTLCIPLYHYDCTNESSYMHYLTQEKSLEGLKSFDYVKDFFKDKSPECKSALDFALLKMLNYRIINYILYNQKSKEYYRFLVSKVETIDKAKWSKLPLNRRIVFYIKNETFCRVYLLCANFFKNIFNKFIHNYVKNYR